MFPGRTLKFGWPCVPRRIDVENKGRTGDRMLSSMAIALSIKCV